MIPSVIIPTYNGERKLYDTLDALCVQSFTAFETVVVVDGSTDRTIDVLEKYKSALNLQVYVQANKGRAAARNTGARNATGDLLIFLDDDIAVGPENVERHFVFHQQRKGDVLVGKPVLDPLRIKDDSFLIYRSMSEKSWNEKHELGLNKVTFQNYVFTTQNVSMTRTAFFEAGGFNEKLTDSEDFDLSVRLLLKDLAIYYDTTLHVLHHDYADLESTIRRQSEYYKAKEKLLSLHPEYQSLMPAEYLWRKKRRNDTLKFVIFEKLPGWKMFFRSSFFKVLPQTVKNVMYSSYIYTKSVLPVKSSPL